MDLRTLATPSTAARANVRLIGQGPGPAFAGYEVPLADIDIRLSAALSLSGYATKLTWAELAAVTGTPGAFAIIPLHAGTHTDPVTGATVQNTGVYKWSTSPAGWERKFDTQALAAQQVLLDPGFVLVAGDLALGVASKIGVVSTNIAPIVALAGVIANINILAPISAAIVTVSGIAAAVSTVSANAAAVGAVATDLGLGASSLILQAINAASAVIAAASTYLVPTYADDISTGARGATGSNVLTIVTDLAISAGSIANLINGSATNDDTNGVRFATGQDVTAKRLVSVTTNGKRVSKLVGKLKFKQSTNAAYGTYQPRVRDMFGSWSNHGSTVAIGGATEYEVDLNALAKTGITGFELVGTAGVTPSNAVRMQELEIQSVDAPRKGVLIAPASDGLPGDAFVNGDLPDLAPVAKPKYYSPASQGGIACNYEYWFDNPVGVDVLKNRRGPLGHFDYSAGTYGKPTRTARGHRFQKQMITASWAGVREIMILKRCAINTPINETEASTGVSGNPFYLKGQAYRGGAGGQTIKALSPFNTLMPLFGSTSGTVTQNASFLNTGGWVLLFITLAADFTGTISLGGDIDDGATATNRVSDGEIALIKTWPAALASDADRLAEADWVCRELAFSRGIRLRGQECRRKRDIVTMIGESQMAGQALVSDRPKQIREMASIPHVLIHSHERADGNFTRCPAPFVAGSSNRNHLLDPSPTAGLDGRQAGPEWKLAIRHYLSTNPIPLGIEHGGAPSSILGGNTGLSWLASTAPGTGLLYFHLARLYESWRWYLENDEAPVMVSLAWGQGWNNCNLAAPSDYQTSYDAYYEAMIAAWLLYTGQSAIRQIIYGMPPLPGANTTHDPAKFAIVKQKLVDVAAADPANRVFLAAPTIGATDMWAMQYAYQLDLLHYGSAILDYQGDGTYSNTVFSAS